MAKDVKLEQLKNAQEQAFRKKQDAYKLQQSSWGYVVDARNKANRAFDAKQAAYKSQEQAWQDYRSVCDRNGSRIDYLNSAQERAYQNMKDAFDRATSAHNSHDGAYAKAYSIEGRSYQAEAKSCVEERRQLVEECRNAKARHEPYKQAFENAKIAYNCAKAEREKAEAIHERNETDFKRAKANFDTAEKSFQARLNELKAENAKKKESNRILAERAGVPSQYLDSVKVDHDSRGTINFYFGGIGEKDGLWHGHIAMDSYDKVTYKRLPLEDHGSKNYTGANGIFNGMPAKIVMSDCGNSDRINIYFGGIEKPDGTGHNHVTVIKDNVRFWRENGLIIIDERTGIQ